MAALRVGIASTEPACANAVHTAFTFCHDVAAPNMAYGTAAASTHIHALFVFTACPPSAGAQLAAMLRHGLMRHAHRSVALSLIDAQATYVPVIAGACTE